MELKIAKQDDKTLMVEVGGETSTVTHALREALWEDKSVSQAAHVQEHPQMAQPKIFVQVNRGSPEAALEKAAGLVEAQAKEFKEEFKKALK
ncbi:hypothetical protein EPN87_00075 [archaeon]|nr:MAG: hypothetical protein EPN87_00075 [archaeon]